jgi:tetratricopeptide (TPR) repeat protein
VIWGNLGAAYYWAPGERSKANDAFLHAIKLGEEARKVNPNDPQLISSLAGFYAMVGKKDKALEDIDKSLKLSADDAEIMYRTGTTYEQLGDRKKAIDWIIKSIKNGYSRSEIENQPELKKLLSDERYKKLVSQINKKSN